MRKNLPRPVTAKDDGARPWQKRIWRKFSYFVPLTLVLMVLGGVVLGSWRPATSFQAHAASACIPDAILVNPCRPWMGAAAGGNPGAPSDPISQATYLEQLVGQDLDIFRFYDNPGKLPLDPNTATGQAEIHFAERANTSIDVNWKPTTLWVNADGNDPTVNEEIVQAAKNIAAVAPHKVFLTIWHEPENDVSQFDNKVEQTACQHDPHFKGLVGTAGTPDQYQAMWQIVQKIFKATFNQLNVTNNVVWAMDYLSSPSYCLIPQLWPGNQLIDWVLYDTYAFGKTFADTAGAYYQLLQQQSNRSVDLKSKPWGFGEFNDCSPTVPQDAITYFNDVKTAFQANTYRKIKMYLVFADTGNTSTPGCLTNYDANGQLDPAKQAAFNQLASAVLNRSGRP